MIAIEQGADGGNLYYDTVARQYVDSPESYAPPPTGSAPTTAYDTSPYSPYLTAAYGHLGLGATTPDMDNGIASHFDTNTLGDAHALSTLFDTGYLGTGANVNPYASLQNRDALRQVAQKLGLTADQADQAALKVAQDNYNQYGGPYSEGTHPAIIADQIARNIFAQAGKPYQGLSQEQITQYGNDATKYEQNFNDVNAHDWQKDAIGGAFAFLGQVGQDRWETLLNDPERAATPGPISTWLQNKALNHNNDPVTDIWGGATKQDYQQANSQGINTEAADSLQWTTEQAAAMLGGQALTSGLTNAGLTPAEASAASGAIKGAAGGMQNNASAEDILKGGITNAATSGGLGAAADATGLGDYADTANTAGKAYGAYQAYNSGNPLGAAVGAAGVGGNLYAKADTGTLTDAAPDTKSAGTTGGAMWDENGNWVDTSGQPDFSQGYYGNDTSNANTGSGFDEYGNPVDQYGSASGGQQGAYQDPNLGGSGGNWWDSLTGAGQSGLASILKLFSGGGGSGSAAAGGTANTGTAAGGINLAKILSGLGSGALGVAGAKNVANKYDSMANRFEGYGADYRNRLSSLYADPSSFLNSAEVQVPVQQGTNALARSLSMKGNPAGSPAAMQEIQDYSANQLFGRLGEEKNRLGTLGGIVPLQQAAPGAASKAADASGGQYTAAGYGLDQAFGDQNSLTSLANQLKKLGLA